MRDIETAWSCFKVSDCANETVIEYNRMSFLRVCTWGCAKGLLVFSKWFAVGVEYSHVFFVFTFSFCFICSNELETQWVLLLIVWRGFAESSDRAVYCSSSQYAFVSWDCGLVRSSYRRQDLRDNRWESLSKETLPCHPQDVIQHLVHKLRVVICIIFLFFYLNTGKQTVVFSQWVIRTELLNNTTIVHGTVSSELSWKGVHRLSSVCIRELFDTRAQELTESNFSTMKFRRKFTV